MTSHTNCSHEATKSARAKCRRDASRPVAEATTIPADPFDLFPEPEDDWADADRYFGTGDDSGSGYADLLDR